MSRNRAVQKICKVAKDEREVRGDTGCNLGKPEKGEEILSKAVEKNKETYKFEKMLEQSSDLFY